MYTATFQYKRLLYFMTKKSESRRPKVLRSHSFVDLQGYGRILLDRIVLPVCLELFGV